jgi:hypothetical protein
MVPGTRYLRRVPSTFGFFAGKQLFLAIFVYFKPVNN